jgi:hypothetical protein
MLGHTPKQADADISESPGENTIEYGVYHVLARLGSLNIVILFYLY